MGRRTVGCGGSSPTPGSGPGRSFATEKSVEYRFGRIERNYALVNDGDLVIGYETSPTKRILAVARITEGLHTTPQGEKITVVPVAPGRQGTDMGRDRSRRDPGRTASRSGTTVAGRYSLCPAKRPATCFRGSPSAIRPCRDLTDADAAAEVGYLTRVTFHPSYTYEDFVEGYKPQADRVRIVGARA